jgi:hypothetical protein
MSFDNKDLEFRFPPDWGSPILSWASPRFEAVFVFLHPFFRVPDELCDYIEKGGSRWLEPGGYEKLVRSPVDHVPWTWVMNDLEIPTYALFNDIINGHAVGSFALKTATSTDVEKLDSYLRLHKMVSPQTHYLPTTLKPQIQDSINKFGIGSPTWSKSPYEKENLLYATPYECAYSFICSSKKLLETIVQTYNFEGFFAEPNTKFDWTEGAKHETGTNTGAMAWKVRSDKKKR